MVVTDGTQINCKPAKKAELPRKPCPECGKLLTNVKEHIKSVHWQVHYSALHNVHGISLAKYSCSSAS